MDLPEKRQTVEEDVSDRLDEDRWRLSDHARGRMMRRQLLLPEVEQALSSGIHVPEEDEWDDDHEAWNYAIEGETIDQKRLRIAVSFVEDDDMLVVTVITPGK